MGIHKENNQMERCQLSWLNPLRESVYLAIYLSIIPGNALLTLDLIIINHFVTRLQPDNHLLELSLRDQVVSPVPDIKKLTDCSPDLGALRLQEPRVLPSPHSDRPAQWQQV